MVNDHEELPMFRYGFKCSCGVVSMGTAEDPALFSDHLRQISELPFMMIARD